MDETVNPAARDPAVAGLLREVGHAERRLAEAIARDLRISPIDLHAMGALLAGGPTGVVDLGRALGLGSAAATGLADRLEAAGYAVRSPHPHDRRRLVLTPTDAGRRALLTRLDALSDDVETFVADFDAAERDAIDRFLAGVGAIYRRHAGAG